MNTQLMKYFIFLVSFFICANGYAQFRSDSYSKYIFPQHYFGSPQKTFIRGLNSDPVQNYRLTSPLLLNTAQVNNTRFQNNSFWTGTVTSMSYNKGKFGTYYYWDVQGNLRGTRGFFDLSGKNKRGFKLLFPWKFTR